MEKGSTKERILKVALDLFSVKGYEATSIAQIADAVGIRKASLYSHFASKQDILDTITSTLQIQYNEHSLFANANWEDPEFTKGLESMQADDAVRMVLSHLEYSLHDPQISKVRKMLTIEQFQNPQMAILQSKQSYDDILNYNLGMIRFLISRNILRDENPEIMAAQFAWPISMWLVLCDREPSREEEAKELITRHIQQFFKIYGK